jgi:alpha-ribazole phosphatase
VANIYLLRHGKVSGEAALYGHTDVDVAPDVNALIVKQLVAMNLEVNSVITSPLKRCFNLAELLSHESKSSITSLEPLKEINFGLYDGVPFDELHQDKNIWQSLERFWQNPVQHPLPKAELLTGFSFRVINAWQMIIDKVMLEPLNQNIIVVCHGGVIRMILAHLLNIDFRNPLWYTNLSIANGSLTSIEIKNKQTRVKQIAKPLLELDNSAVHFNSTSEFPYCLLEQSQGTHLKDVT